MLDQNTNEIIVDSMYANSYENLVEVESLFKDIMLSYQLSHGDDAEGLAKMLSYKLKNGLKNSLKIFIKI